MKTKPSDFTDHPFASVTRNCECEVVAAHIMVILKRTGNIWRTLPWAEYTAQRIKDGHFTESEAPCFRKVNEYCVSAAQAKKFSRSWRD